MPPIKVFGRKWKVASDDFVYPMISEIIIRLFWFILVLTVFLIYRNDLSLCERILYLKSYCTGLLLILAINIFFNFILMRNSMKGNIFDESGKRRLVPCLIIGKLVLFIPEIVWMILGTILLFSDLSDCPSGLILTLKITLLLSWGLLLSLMIFIIVIFDPLGSTSQTNEIPLASRLWKLRCRMLCCWMNQNEIEKDSFEEISKLIAAYFHGVDMTVTDIAAGLVLMNDRQKLRGPTNESMLIPYNMDHPVILPNVSSKPEEWMTLDNAKHFMRFALASYGWMFFVYDRKFMGPFQLCCSCRIPCGNIGNIHGDKCCHCNTNAIIQQTKIDHKDIIYACFENKLFEIPFYVALDHNFKSIVVSVRGTLSFYDAVTDLRIESEDMDLNIGHESLAHKGILQAATYINNLIIEKNLLSQPMATHPDYKLVITGHSLGAGAASILSVLLKSHYPELICFAFSPPGWLVSLSLSQYMENFVCSVIVGKDLVPRMGVYTMNALKSNLYSVVKQSEQPKYKILFRAFLRACCGSKKRYTEQSQIIPENISESFPIEDTHPILDNPKPLYIPGKIMYLEAGSTIRTCCTNRNVYKAYWAKRDFFNEILISPKMVTHHKPDVVYKALKAVLNQELI